MSDPTPPGCDFSRNIARSEWLSYSQRRGNIPFYGPCRYQSGMVRRMRLAPWMLVSIAISFLFTGNEQNILVRIQHNWSGAVIVLVVGFIYHSRFGLTRKNVGQQIRYIILIPLIVICAMVAPTCLYYSYYSRGRSVAIDKKGHFQ